LITGVKVKTNSVAALREVANFTGIGDQFQRNTQPWSGVRHLALAAVADLGYESASLRADGSPATFFGGGGLLHRVVLDDHWAFTLRTSTFSDPQRLVALVPPSGAAGSGPLWVGEGTATLDYNPSPWILYRLEVRHDVANSPYIAGPGGITGSTPDWRTQGSRAMLNATFRM
jgi:hypothetical protein